MQQITVGQSTVRTQRPVCHLHASRHQARVGLGGALVVRLGDAVAKPGHQWVVIMRPMKVHPARRAMSVPGAARRKARTPQASESGEKSK